MCGKQLSRGREGLPAGAKLLCTIAAAGTVALAATLTCPSAGRGRGRSPHRSPRIHPRSETWRYRCSCAILLLWPAAPPPPGLRLFQHARSCTKLDGVTPRAMRQTSCNVRKRTQQRNTAAIVVTVAIAVTAAATDTVTATITGGHRTPPSPASAPASVPAARAVPCSASRANRGGGHAQIPAELRIPGEARPRTAMDRHVPLLPASRIRGSSVERTQLRLQAQSQP